MPVEALNSGAYFYDVYWVLRTVVEAPRAPSILVLEDGSLSLFGPSYSIRFFMPKTYINKRARLQTLQESRILLTMIGLVAIVFLYRATRSSASVRRIRHNTTK